MPNVHDLVAESDQPSLPLVYPLLQAWHACQEAAEREKQLGAAEGDIKRQYQAITQPVSLIQSHQQYAHDERSVADHVADIARREQEAITHKAALRTMHQDRL